MSRTLQEQLVQAGLASAEQAADPGRKRRHKGTRRGKARRGGEASSHQRSREDPAGGATPSAQASRATAEAPVSKRQHKRQLAEEVAAIVTAHGLERARGEVPYRFTRGARIKETWVSTAERNALARGEVALIALRGRYGLLPAEHVAAVRAIDPAAVLVFLEGGAGEAGEAEHPVPDDLIW